MQNKRNLDLGKPNLSGVVLWLSNHDLTPVQIADILGLTPGDVGVQLHRIRKGKTYKRERENLNVLDNRLRSTNRAAFSQAVRIAFKHKRQPNVLAIESKVREYSEKFWPGVTLVSGATELGKLLQEASAPARGNLRRWRTQAQLYSLFARTYGRAGYALWAIKSGIEAYGLWEWIFKQSSNALDLEQVAESILTITNACISRRDTKRASDWLDLAKEAFECSNSIRRWHPDPEYLRQRASIARGGGDIEAARRLLLQARAELPYTVPEATEAQLDDMADRVLNVIADVPKWDDSLRLFQSALESWPALDSHPSSNLLWAVSGGLQTDSPAIHAEAMGLLEQHPNIADGLALQTTGLFLLKLTPRVPAELRNAWAMFAISYNAYAAN